MKRRVNTLQIMGCLGIVHRWKNDRVMHKNFVLKRGRVGNGAVRRHNDYFTVCRNENVAYQQDSLSLMAHHFIAKSINCLSIRRILRAGLIDLWERLHLLTTKLTGICGDTVTRIVESGTGQKSLHAQKESLQFERCVKNMKQTFV